MKFIKQALKMCFITCISKQDSNVQCGHTLTMRIYIVVKDIVNDHFNCRKSVNSHLAITYKDISHWTTATSYDKLFYSPPTV